MTVSIVNVSSVSFLDCKVSSREVVSLNPAAAMEMFESLIMVAIRGSGPVVMQSQIIYITIMTRVPDLRWRALVAPKMELRFHNFFYMRGVK